MSDRGYSRKSDIARGAVSRDRKERRDRRKGRGVMAKAASFTLAALLITATLSSWGYPAPFKSYGTPVQETLEADYAVAASEEAEGQTDGAVTYPDEAAGFAPENGGGYQHLTMSHPFRTKTR
jgi:hypothetical protein